MPIETQMLQALERLHYDILVELARRMKVPIPDGCTKSGLAKLLVATVPDDIAPDLETVIRLELRHMEGVLGNKLDERLNVVNGQLGQKVGIEQLKDRIDASLKGAENLQKLFSGLGVILALITGVGVILGSTHILDLEKFKNEQQALIQAQTGAIYSQCADDFETAMKEVSTLEVLRTKPVIDHDYNLLKKLQSAPDLNVLSRIAKNLLDLELAMNNHGVALDDATESWSARLPGQPTDSKVVELVNAYPAYQENILGMIEMKRFNVSRSPKHTELLASAEEHFLKAATLRKTFDRPYSNLGNVFNLRIACKEGEILCDQTFKDVELKVLLKSAEENHMKAVDHPGTWLSRSVTNNNFAMYYVHKAKAEITADPKRAAADLQQAQTYLEEAEHYENRSIAVPETLAQVKVYRLSLSLPAVEKLTEAERAEKVADIEDLVRMAQEGSGNCRTYVTGLLSDVKEFGVLKALNPEYDLSRAVCSTAQ
jgi:hypothetical protein